MMSQRDMVMAPFAILADATLNHQSGAAVYLRQNSVTAPGDDPARNKAVQDLLSGLSPSLKSQGWTLSPHFGIARSTPDPEPENQTAEEYHLRLASCMATLKNAGVTGSEELRSTPAGWMRVMEEACNGIAGRMSIESDVKVVIRQIKEKFGTLRFYVEATGPEDFAEDIEQIASWAELSSENRCVITGKPGTLDNAGWVLTLCDEMQALRKRDHKAMAEMVYPRAPRPEDDMPTL
jgi:hypothetical protein